MSRLDFLKTLNALPPEWAGTSPGQVAEMKGGETRKVVVLDDDPTGTQTVYDTPVWTEWSVTDFEEELQNRLPALYLLTNTRSMPPKEACRINREIGSNLMEAMRRTGRDAAVISRGDSTLRGHFPEETQALADAFGQDFDAWLFIPFLFTGGRYTIDDVHYVLEKGWLIPVGETEFAQDKAFGYRSSNLRKWVEEKTGGRVKADRVGSISLSDIRTGGPERVKQELLELPHGSICVVNAVSMRDMQVFTAGLHAAENSGKRYLYRAAASFISAYLGVSPRPRLTCQQLQLPAAPGGLIVVGSYVLKTTTQVNALISSLNVIAVEVPVARLLDEQQREAIVRRAAEQASQGLHRGSDVVIYTSRDLVAGEDAESSLAIGNLVSQSMIDILWKIPIRPRYILAKGGITSSDIATKGLCVRRATVLGYILDGVAVWRLGEESRFPGMIYVVFPGNVGDAKALADTVSYLKSG